MAIKVIEGIIAETTEPSALSSDDPASGQPVKTGVSYAHVRVQQPRGKQLIIDQVVADLILSSNIAIGVSGRFAFYQHRDAYILCGFSDGSRVDVAAEAQDPAAIAAEVQRTLAKRKIFFGIVMIPTIILITFGIDKLKEGRRMLKANPRPKRPTEMRIRKALERR